MSPIFKKQIVAVLAGAITANAGLSEAIKINAPKLREDVLTSGKRLVEQPKPVEFGGPNFVDPFSGVAATPTDANDVSPNPVSVEGQESESEIIVKLAGEIPATGTILFGDKRILLAGKKKYKTGDVIIVKYKELEYDLAITDITATTFTVKHNQVTHSRAVK